MDLTGIGSIADLASTVVNKFFPDKMSDDEKAKTELELQELFKRHERARIDAQKDIIVAEMQQGDNYTKRARPSVVYMGLGFIMLIHVLFPIIAFFTKGTVPTLSLPEEFWWSWTGCVSIWTIGRSVEKIGKKSSFINIITGNK